MRIGHGFDVHRLEPIGPEGKARPFVLGGVRFDHPLGPVAHSDGDALLHAVTDALLGALAHPDIGQLFPDNDPRHDAQDSAVFLHEAVCRVRESGLAIANVDATVVLQSPRIGARKEEIRASLAELLGLPESRVNIKGRTGEHLDAVGEGRAIHVHAVVLLVPGDS